jgi:hypothetical protein
MNKLVIICLCLCLLACKKEPIKIKSGQYEGTFIYDTLQLWESFGINNQNFVEYASGGVFSQKYPTYCLTKGTYHIQDGMISFSNIEIAQPPNGKVNDCDQDFLLMGSFTIDSLTDSSISFWRNSNLGKQKYNLKIFYSDK